MPGRKAKALAKKADPDYHPYLDLKLPPDAPFVLKPSPGKGWGAFATRDIKAGSLIMTEDAVLVTWGSGIDGKVNFENAARVLTQEADLRDQYNQLPKAAKQQLDLIQQGRKEVAGFGTLSELLDHNSFTISPTASNSQGRGLFPLHSRINHSCIPNVKVPMDTGKRITSHAKLDISAGQELLFTYSARHDIMTSRERREQLGFVCNCKACLPGTTFNHLSDIRRCFLRGLEYLMIGRGWDGKIQTSGPPIISDPVLKKKAEEQDLMLTSRIIYGLCYLWLLQEEGLDDDTTVRATVENLIRGVSAIKTERNYEILEPMFDFDWGQYSKNKTPWLDMFCIAARLWGRADENDAYVTERTRIVRKSEGLEGL